MFDQIIDKINDAIGNIADEDKAYDLLEQIEDDLDEAERDNNADLSEVEKDIQSAMIEFSDDPLTETGIREVTACLNDAIEALKELEQLYLYEGTKR